MWEIGGFSRIKHPPRWIGYIDVTLSTLCDLRIRNNPSEPWEIGLWGLLDQHRKMCIPVTFPQRLATVTPRVSKLSGPVSRGLNWGRISPSPWENLERTQRRAMADDGKDRVQLCKEELKMKQWQSIRNHVESAICWCLPSQRKKRGMGRIGNLIAVRN